MSECQADGMALQRKRLRRQQRWLKRLVVTSVLVGLGVGSWAFEDAGAPQGLKGILPQEVPAALTAEAFHTLGETWQEWSQGAATAIADFYKADGDVAAQKAALKKVKVKLGVLNKAISDSQYSMILEDLLAIRGPLARRVAIAEAVLATLEADSASARAAGVKAGSDAVTAAFGALQSDLNSIPGGAAWLPFIQADALGTAWAAATDSDATVAALLATHARLALRNTLTDESQKAFLSRSAFVALGSAIETHLAAIELAKQPVDLVATRAALGELVAAIEDYETYSSSVDAGKVRAAADKLSSVAPDGGAAVKWALEENYYNLNLRLVASESFLNRLLADCRIEQGQVCDYILGAQVGGWQTTSTSVTVNVQPSSDRIRMDLVLSGVVQSTTAGRTPQATIYTSGHHTFHSTKEVSYDGMKFATGPAATGVRAHNTTTGAKTRLSGLPIFGKVSERIAVRAAGERRPEAESIAAGRIWSRVNPRFDEEVDKAFSKASNELDSQLVAGLKETGLYPDRQALMSSGEQISLASRLMGDGKLGGDSAEPTLSSVSSGAAMLMHESVVNNAIDQIGFNGKKMSEAELRLHLEAFLSKALAREFKFRSPEAAAVGEAPAPVEGAAADVPPAAAPAEEAEDKTPAKLAFAENDAVRVQFRNGILTLVIRAGLERENEEPIPAHEIVVPLLLSVSGDKLVVKRDALQIAPIEGEAKPVQLRVMNSRISKALPDREVDATFTLKSTDKEVPARVTSIQSVDGWIVVRVE